MLASYNKKLQDLQLEKRKNDGYLAQRKEELLGEFYEIRELVEN